MTRAEENLAALEADARQASTGLSYFGSLVIGFGEGFFSYRVGNIAISREAAIQSVATFLNGSPTMRGESV